MAEDVQLKKLFKHYSGNIVSIKNILSEDL